ncbi:MAG: OmpA family protein [Myxococcota bacterium]
MAPTRTPVLGGLVLAGLACSVACGGTEKFTMGRLAVQAMPPATSADSDSFSTPPSEPPPPPRTVRRAPPPPPPPVEPAPVRDDFDEPDPVSSSVVIRGERIEIREKVQFETWKADIRRGSFGLLDEISELLRRNRHVRKVEIQGHTARTVNRREQLRPLSQRRANAVRSYLIRKGIEPSRLVARGYGYKRPIADNTTPTGRSANRRVEFVILEQGVPPVGAAPADDFSSPPPVSAPPPQPPASPPPSDLTDDFGDSDFADDDEFEDDEFDDDEDF